MVNHGWRYLRSRLVGAVAPGALERFAGWALTFICVIAAWVLFRAHSFAGGVAILKAMFGLNGIYLPPGAQHLAQRLPHFVRPLLVFTGQTANQLVQWQDGMPIMALGLAIVLLAPNTYQLFAAYRPVLDRIAEMGSLSRLRWRPTPVWIVATAALLVISIGSFVRVSAFIYYQF